MEFLSPSSGELSPSLLEEESLSEGSSRMTRVFFLKERLVELLVLELLCPLVGGLFIQDIHFPGLPLVILLGGLRIFLAFSLEDIALSLGVTGVFTIKRAIQIGMLLLEFLTMLVFVLEALFLPLGVTVLV